MTDSSGEKHSPRTGNRHQSGGRARTCGEYDVVPLLADPPGPADSHSTQRVGVTGTENISVKMACSRKPGETTALCWRLLKEERQNSTRWHSQAVPDWNAQQAQATEVTTASCRSVLSREGRGHAWWRRVGVRGWKQDDLYFS